MAASEFHGGYDPTCIFCKIANKEIPASIIYETNDVIAFDDNTPQAPVHVLVIPKAHYASVQDKVPSHILAAVFEAAAEVARIKGIDESGYRLITNCGKAAGQTVFHFHVHVLGGKTLNEGLI